MTTIEWRGPLPESNMWHGREAHAVQFVTIHTMVGTWEAADARFHNSTAQVSAHYGVKLDGGVISWVPEADTAYHAGDLDVNYRSVGIEHEDGGDYSGVRPDVLYAASAALINDICTAHQIPIQAGHYPDIPGIIAHRDVHATSCPDALDVARIITEAQKEEDMDGDTVKNLIREMLGSEEGANLVHSAILHQPNGYGPALASELDQRFRDVEAKSIVEAQAGVKPECLKPSVNP